MHRYYHKIIFINLHCFRAGFRLASKQRGAYEKRPLQKSSTHARLCPYALARIFGLDRGYPIKSRFKIVDLGVKYCYVFGTSLKTFRSTNQT